MDRDKQNKRMVRGGKRERGEGEGREGREGGRGGKGRERGGGREGREEKKGEVRHKFSDDYNMKCVWVETNKNGTCLRKNKHVVTLIFAM